MPCNGPILRVDYVAPLQGAISGGRLPRASRPLGACPGLVCGALSGHSAASRPGMLGAWCCVQGHVTLCAARPRHGRKTGDVGYAVGGVMSRCGLQARSTAGRQAMWGVRLAGPCHAAGLQPAAWTLDNFLSKIFLPKNKSKNEFALYLHCAILPVALMPACLVTT